jgi:hypothetical protein
MHWQIIGSLENNFSAQAYRIEESGKYLLVEDKGERPEHGLQEGGPEEGHLLGADLSGYHTLHVCYLFKQRQLKSPEICLRSGRVNKELNSWGRSPPAFNLPEREGREECWA